jgi:organic radical activating enzyme
MSISDWHNSEPMKKARMMMSVDQPIKECYACHYQEEYSDTSRRCKSNQKSIIFTKQNFNESYLQSPNYDVFEHSFQNAGKTNTMPVDLHIDLGNYCNLACKFCRPEASSKIAAQYAKWGELTDRSLLGVDWTRDSNVWNNFVKQLFNIPNLQNIHFMGGETLITPKFEELIDTFILNERFDVCVSFVTNGTIFNEDLLSKLSKFKRVGIEISIETLTDHNEYIRQGTSNDVVIGNINKYIKLSTVNESINVVIRPAVSLLSVGYYHTLLKFCLDTKIIVKSNNVTDPLYLNIRILPKEIRQKYKQNYLDLKERIVVDEIILDYNESDSHNYKFVILSEIDKCLTLLDQDDVNHDLFPDLVESLTKWDKVYKFNANDLYPEFSAILNEHGYVS